MIVDVVLEHSSDASSAAVRAQALSTTATLLEIPQSHSVLRPLLPSLGNLIHDKAEKVRLAAVKLLRRIKQTPGIHFYHVVPIEHISARFSAEEKLHRNPKNAVNKELTALMLSSYFPQGRNITASDQMQRTVAFIMTDPVAAASFYSNLPDYLEVESIAKFIIMLLGCLKAAVDTEQAQQLKNAGTKKKRRRGPSLTDSSEQNDQRISASNCSLMVGLSEAMCTLLDSIQGCLDQTSNEPVKMLLQDRLYEANLANILVHFEEKALTNQPSSNGESNSRHANFRTCRAILRCASCLPKDNVNGIADYVSDSLEAIANDGTIASAHVSAHLSLIATWGMVEDIAKGLADSLESSMDNSVEMRLLSPSLESTNTRRKSRSRMSKGCSSKIKSILSAFPSKFSCSVLNDILRGSSASSLMLREKLFASTKATQIIENALLSAMDFIGRALDNQPVRSSLFPDCVGLSIHSTIVSSSQVLVQPFEDMEIDTILSCCEAYGRFALHRARSESKDEICAEIRFLLNWTTKHVMPVLLGDTPAGSELQDLDLSRISNVSDSLLYQESPGLMSPPKQRANLGPKARRPSSDTSQTIGLPTSCHSFADLVARSLMQSSCLVLSELLVFNSANAKQIGSMVSRWCSIFDEREADEERISGMKRQLLPSFLRLAVQLGKSRCGCVMLKELLVKCDDAPSGKSENRFKKAATLLLHASFKDDSPLLTDLANALLSACEQLLRSKEITQEFQPAKSADEVWPGDVVGSVVEVFSTHCKAFEFLAEKLLSKLLTHGGTVNKDVMFYAKFLSFFFFTKKSNALLERILHEVKVERPQFQDFRSIMERVVAISA